MVTSTANEIVSEVVFSESDRINSLLVGINEYQNVLEPLVTAEFMRQLEQLPSRLVNYINPAQVVAYALNRLPPLYATSIEGWTRQQQRAENELSEQIFWAVRQGLAAVQRDPLKVSTPFL